MLTSCQEVGYAGHMADFGDSDPEDAWDAGDPPEVKLALLVQIVTSILNELTAHGVTPRHLARVSSLHRLSGEV